MILKMVENCFEILTFNLSNAYNFYTHVYFVYFENVNWFQFFFKKILISFDLCYTHVKPLWLQQWVKIMLY
jgi:hypothetical protein